MTPHQVTKDFEENISTYCGSNYAVATTSCTAALLIALDYEQYLNGRLAVGVPRRTYCSVPMTVIQAGHDLYWRDVEWRGAYRLEGTRVWDSARRTTSNQYIPGSLMCLSFQASKILAGEQGGCVLTDSLEAYEYLIRARFDGRTPGLTPDKDRIDRIGFHCYPSPSVSAALLMKLSVLPKHNADLPNSNYPDLSTLPCFQSHQNGAIRVA